MGTTEELEAMVKRHELDATEPSFNKAEAMLTAADRSLKTARMVSSKDPDSALLLA